MRSVQYIAIGVDGNLYITERGTTAPLRFGVFNANTGTWVRDYYGPVAYVYFFLFFFASNNFSFRYQTVIPDIDDNQYVYYVTGVDYPGLVKAKVFSFIY